MMSGSMDSWLEVCDLGIDLPSSFQGFGYVGTRFDHSVVGQGESRTQAVWDALGQVEELVGNGDYYLAVEANVLDQINVDEDVNVIDQPYPESEEGFGEFPQYYVGVRWKEWQPK